MKAKPAAKRATKSAAKPKPAAKKAAKAPNNGAKAPKYPRLEVRNFGPIKHADVTFGDITVLVGPQASGKSLLLQTYKLINDWSTIQDRMKEEDLSWGSDYNLFLSLYFGEGLARAWKYGISQVELNGSKIDLSQLPPTSWPSQSDHNIFLIPAQRVLTLRNSFPESFKSYDPGVPFCVKEFSNYIRSFLSLQVLYTEVGDSLQKEILEDTDFARQFMSAKASGSARSPVLWANVLDLIFGKFSLRVERIRGANKLVLGGAAGEDPLLPMVWSTGQREIAPLLLGLRHLEALGILGYPVFPESRNALIVEEPEMGLHPRAILLTLFLLLEAVAGGKELCLSTHSPNILEAMWGLSVICENGGDAKDVLRLFNLPSEPSLEAIATELLKKSIRIYYMDRDTGLSTDISKLDLDSDDPIMSEWGGMLELAGRVGDVVADVVNRSKRG